MRTLVGLFLVAHGLVTALIWASPRRAVADGRWRPPDPSNSWLLGDLRTLSVVLGLTIGLALAIAGIGFLTHQPWWPAVGLTAAVCSLFLFALFFAPWWLVGIAISTALFVGALRTGFGS